jgi:hypothetical protein
MPMNDFEFLILKVNNLVFIHSSLRLTDKVSNITYKEDTIKWSTDTDTAMEEIDSNSEDDVARD